MSSAEDLYLRLPVPLQQVACSLEGWRIERRRFGPRFRELLAEAEGRTFWSRDQVEAYRDRRLRAFLEHAAATVPFYRRRFREAGVGPGEIRSLDGLARLPILTKWEVQDHHRELLSERVPARMRRTTKTSGTTGTALELAITLTASQEQWAVWWRDRRWHGIDLGTWCGVFGGRSVAAVSQRRPPFWRYNYPGKQVIFSGYHMSPRSLPSYFDELERKDVPWLHGFPSLITLLAAHRLEEGRGSRYAPRWITTGSEILFAHQAETIRRAFGVTPTQHYGMAEAVANISQCERGALHVDEDFAAVEFVPDPEAPGTHRVIGTNFSNPAMPLVRYDTGDRVTLDGTSCACGRPGRTVATIDGRHNDYVVLRNGVRLVGMSQVFKGMANVREAQLHQRRPGEVTVRVVRGRRYTSADERELLQELRMRLGEATELAVEYVDAVERSPNGKLRLIVSEVGSIPRDARDGETPVAAATGR